MKSFLSFSTYQTKVSKAEELEMNLYSFNLLLITEQFPTNLCNIFKSVRKFHLSYSIQYSWIESFSNKYLNLLKGFLMKMLRMITIRFINNRNQECNLNNSKKKI